jgi:putative cardiolipin synthase
MMGLLSYTLTTTRRLALLLCLPLILLAGCAGLPPATVQAPSEAIPISTDTALGRAAMAAAAAASAPAGASGFRIIPQASVALDARLTLIRRAQSSLDLQYYLLGNDEVGHLVVRELRDAADRGVRVRLLIDDFYTTGMDRLLLGLAAHPNVQVRLFNPFGAGRVSTGGRWVSMASEFRRLNHRMHNKLFVADGAIVIAGGRNLADGYFLRDHGANFIDFDVLGVGPIVPQLAEIFDQYWNSPLVRDIETVARTTESAPELREAFEMETAVYARRPMAPPPDADAFNVPMVGNEIDAGLPHLTWSQASAFADAPGKALNAEVSGKILQSAAYHNLETFKEARSEVMLFTPYFVPGVQGLERLKFARDHHITVRVVTNSMASTDEPLAALAYERYRVAMLRMGVELYELSEVEFRKEEAMSRFFGSSRAQLHAKLGIIDRRMLVVGSTNLDQRSITTNTELAVVIRSPEIALRTLSFFNSVNPNDARGVYQLKLAPDNKALRWIALHGDKGSEALEGEPEIDRWLRLKLFLMSVFVPEDWL